MNEIDRELSLKLFIVLARASRSVTDEIKTDIQSYGLNPTEFAVLELLYHKGSQPLQQIGEKILLASGSITYVVDKLEGKGYLTRNPCPNDRRITHAVISNEGKSLMDRIFPDHMKQVQSIFAGLDISEKETAIGLLKKLGHYAEKL
ncbi:MarR family winged helix-turn-helix transcriptional regulator [Guptibacillus hwajinpoensis]|uniref:MarR family 2-MHQ and catechol resistance regulon transcriptional repressor n=1 Tax=Guptibacillus hwajinpoensis TaxID=208199 RepID=A0ABU0JYI0_9BACL|nr:MarR family transcriptional regulator [Alkalihalobacillus hemicentroti]MDQ0482177.1 MarR family 2-MHQ and catechol resistance regulon transcriptional repressor [Alkalihalobacillus hemicentroti]